MDFAEILGEVETYLSVLPPGLLKRPLLEWAAAFRDQAIVTSDVEAYEVAHGNRFHWNLKEVSGAQGPLLHKLCRGSAGVMLKAVMKTDGFNAWRVLAFWFQARSTNGSMLLDKAKDLSDMMNKVDRWDAQFRDNEIKFEKAASLTRCAKHHCSLWLPKPREQVGWVKRPGELRESPLHYG